MRVILLGHQARTGKDTIATYLVQHHKFYCYSFAYKLKEICSVMFDLGYEQMHQDKETPDLRYPNILDLNVSVANKGYEPYLTPRRILQTVGQQFRSIYPTVWVDYVIRQIEKRIEAGATDFVISDLRFPNEYHRFVQWSEEFETPVKILPIKVTRKDRPKISNENDISETAMEHFENWAGFIENDGTIDELHMKVKALVQLTDENLNSGQILRNGETHTGVTNDQ